MFNYIVIKNEFFLLFFFCLSCVFDVLGYGLIIFLYVDRIMNFLEIKIIIGYFYMIIC